MDRLLDLLLRRFVRRGTLRITTAGGCVFSFGDGTGRPVAIRFMTSAAQRGVIIDPEVRLGEAYMDGTLQRGGRHHRRFPRAGAGPDAGRHAAGLGAAAMAAALSLPQVPAAQPAHPRAAQRRASLRSRRKTLFAVPRRRPAIFLRLFRSARPVARRRAACEEAPSCRQAPAPRRPPRARHRQRLGRACALHGRVLPRAGHRHHAVARAVPARDRARGRKEPRQRGRIPPAGLPRRAGKIRPHRLGRHVRACRRRLLRRLLPPLRRASRQRRRDAAALDRPLRGTERHQSLDRQIHLSRRLYPGAVGGAALDRARGPARHRHRDPAPALRRNAQALARPLHGASRGGRAHLRSAVSCGCGSSTLPPPKWRSASRR